MRRPASCSLDRVAVLGGGRAEPRRGPGRRRGTAPSTGCDRGRRPRSSTPAPRRGRRRRRPSKKRSIDLAFRASACAGSILNSNGSPDPRGLRGRQRAADRLNLIRVMPAQGDEKGPPARERSSARGTQITRRHRARTRSSSARGVIGLACAWRAAAARARRRSCSSATGPAPAPRTSPPGCSRRSARRPGARTACSSSRSPRTGSGRAFAAELADASGRDVGYLELGALHVALDRDEAAELRRRFELMRAHGLDAEWLAPSACRELEPGLGPGRSRRRPRRRTSRRSTRARSSRRSRPPSRRAGGTIEIAEVTGALIDGERLAGVRTADGDRASRRRGGARRRLVVGGRLAAAEARAAECVRSRARSSPSPDPPAEPVCERIVVTERIYIVPRADGRLVVGATVEEQGFDTRVTAGGVHELLREAYRALPRDRRARAGRGDRRAAPDDPRQRAADRPGRDRRPRPGDRALPQRDPARAADRRPDRGACSPATGTEAVAPMTIELNGERVELDGRRHRRGGGRAHRRRARAPRGRGRGRRRGRAPQRVGADPAQRGPARRGRGGDPGWLTEACGSSAVASGRSRLIVGTGGFRSLEQMEAALRGLGDRDRHGRAAPRRPRGAGVAAST